MRPRVILHNAVSVDGRVDHLQPDLGLFYGLATGFEEDATLAGSETLIAAVEGLAPEPLPEDPLNARETASQGNEAGRVAARPLLVAVDARGRLEDWRPLLGSGLWRGGLSLCSRATPRAHLGRLEAQGVEVIEAGAERVDLAAALERLHARYGVRTVRVDSGGSLNGVLLRAGLVDEVSLLVEPVLVGGTSAKSIYRAPDLKAGEVPVPLELIDVQQPAPGRVWLRYRVCRSPGDDAGG